MRLVLLALPHTRLPGPLVPVVASYLAQIDCPILLGFAEPHVALFIVEVAGREPCSPLVDLDTLH